MKPVWLALVAVAAAGAQTYEIAGVVLQPDGRPGRRVAVAIAPAQAPENRTTRITGNDGAFRFEKLPAGKFNLTAAPLNGAVQTYGQRTLSKGFGTAVVTGPEQDTAHLVFRLIAPAVIRGRVMDAGGEPVENALVQAFVSAIVRGRRQVLYIGYRYTDDRGEYRFSGLRDGGFYVAAGGRPWYVDRVDHSSPLAHTGYALTYYPGTQDARAAAPVVVAPGQEGTADFTLTRVPAVNLKITPRVPRLGTVLLNVLCEGVGGSQGYAYVDTAYNSQPIVIQGVQPGRYTIRASMSDGGRSLYGSQTMVVGNEDAETTVELAEAPVVRGRLRLVDGSTMPRDAYVELENDVEGQHARRAVAADGSFEFDSLAPGRYRVVAGTNERLLHLRGVTLDGAPVREEMVEISRASRLELATSLNGSVRGVVYRAGKPAPGVLAVLAPATPSSNPLDYTAFETDTDGSFEWQALPPGDYVLIVREDWYDLEYANPDALRPLLASGRAVRVGTGGTEKIHIDLP